MKLVLNTILVVLLLLQAKSLRSQIIAGKIQQYNASDLSFIRVYRPINEIPQSWYSEDTDDIAIYADGSFHKKLNATDIGLFTIKLPNGQDAKVYISSPHDSCFIALTDSNKNYSINWFHGSNAHGNYFLNAARPFIFNTIKELSNSGLESESFMKNINKLHNSLVDSVNNFYTKRRINLKTKNFLINNIESEIVYSVHSTLLKLLYTNADKSAVNNIFNSVFETYDPLNPKYLPATHSAEINANNALELAENGLFEKSKFKPADSLWEIKDLAYGKASMLPEPYREATLANYILINLCYLKNSNSKKAIQMFLVQYPYSPYNTIFLKASLSYLSPDSNSTLPVKINDSLYAGEGIYFIADSSGLQHVLDRYFQNKNVLIDCWATWCHYCVEEFKYNDEYKDFLKKNDIEKLFVSFDEYPTTRAWQPMVLEKNLKGYNILINETLKRDLYKITGAPLDKPLPLPRYILINKNKKIVSADFIRPSDTNFIKQLKELL